jgi:hypothetical protein
MRKISFLATVAIVCASIAWAQDPSQQPTTQDPNAQSPSASQSATPSANSTSTSNTGIQGCLSGSDGNYVLTQDGTGTVYKLSGGYSKLRDHVGHEVQVSGQLANSGTPDQTQTGTTGNAAAASASMLQVSDVTMVSEKCLTGSPSASNSPSADASAAAATSSSPDATTSSSAGATNTTPTDSTANAGQTTPDNSSTSTTAINSSATGAAQPSYASPNTTTASAAQAQDNVQSQPAQTSDNDAPMQSNKAVNRSSDSMPKTASDLPEIGLLGLGLLAAGLASKRRNDLLG